MQNWESTLVYWCEGLIPIGHTNSEFQSDLDFKKSNLGCVFTLGGGAISWRSVKQSCIINSTMEAEYVAIMWWQSKLFGSRNSFLILVLWELSKFLSHCFATIVERLHNTKIQGIIRKESTLKESTTSFETLLLKEM